MQHQKILTALLAVLMLFGTACSKEESPTPPEDTADQSAVESVPEDDEDASLPFTLRNFSFLSGAGLWKTELILLEDGSFSGIFHDSNAWETGPEYDETEHESTFIGRFENIEQVDETTWTMTLGTVITEKPSGTEWIEDLDSDTHIRYVASDPYGVESGTTFVLYGPGSMYSNLPEELLSWMLAYDIDTSGTLAGYGLFNQDLGYGFFSFDW